MKDKDSDAARTVIAVGWGAPSGINAFYPPFTGSKERCSFTMEKPEVWRLSIRYLQVFLKSYLPKASPFQDNGSLGDRT